MKRIVALLIVGIIMLTGCAKSKEEGRLQTATIPVIGETETDLQSPTDTSKVQYELYGTPDLQSSVVSDTVSTQVQTPNSTVSTTSRPTVVSQAKPAAPKEDGKNYVIGVVQYDDSYASSETVQGFRDALGEYLEEYGTFVVKNAKGDANQCKKLIRQLIDDKVDLLMTDGPYATAYAASLTATIPIVGGDVTDFASVLNLPQASKTSGVNVTGVTNRVDYTALAAMVKQRLPHVTSMGLVYCANQQDMGYDKQILIQTFAKQGIALTAYGAKEGDELKAVERAAKSNGALLLMDEPSLKAVANTINQQCKLPIITCDPTLLATCGAIGLCPDAYESGMEAGRMGYLILVEHRKPAMIPFGAPILTEYLYHPERCKRLNITGIDQYHVVDIG